MKKPKLLIERLTKTMLNKLRTRKMTNKEAAEELGVSENYLSKIVKSMQDKEPSKAVEERKAATNLFKTRLQFRSKLAKQVLKGTLTYAQAAEEANCTERTMFRHVAKYRPEPKPAKSKRK